MTFKTEPSQTGTDFHPRTVLHGNKWVDGESPWAVRAVRDSLCSVALNPLVLPDGA